MIEVTRAETVARPPRSIAWVLLTASSAAVLLTGLVATAFVLVAATVRAGVRCRRHSGPDCWSPAPLTVVGLGVRSLRWIFLLRRAGTRIPIRDAYIGYLAGFSLLLAPLLLGEIAVRAYILKARGGVSPATTALVNVWERLLDLTALALIVGVLSAAAGDIVLATACLAAVVRDRRRPWRRGAARRLWPESSIASGRRSTSPPSSRSTRLASCEDLGRVARRRVSWHGRCRRSDSGSWSLTWGASFAAWRAVLAYTASTLLAAVTLVARRRGGTGERLLGDLAGAGVAPAAAALLVLGIRLATAGLATALGLVFRVRPLRTRTVDSSRHFDQLADSYDVQIPAARREALLVRKTTMMRDCLSTLAAVAPAAADRGRDAADSTSAAARAGTSAGCANWVSMSPASTRQRDRWRWRGQNLGDAALVAHRFGARDPRGRRQSRFRLHDQCPPSSVVGRRAAARLCAS